MLPICCAAARPLRPCRRTSGAAAGTSAVALTFAREDGRVIGSIIAGYDGYRGHINRVAVLKTHRGRGIGALLVREAESRLSALGCTKINLQIRAANHAVTRFYRSLGYTVEEHISMGKLVGADGPS